ncbi:MAG TPA: metallophosphoesterase [Gemmatimonadaceae bacterium]|nr:metallophosphoesterase [Gemmatimonadaceae bacterium]
MHRRSFLAAGAGAIAAAAGVGVYAWQIEPYWLDVVRRPMPLENLPSALEGRTLLQISDVHVGPRVSSDYLIRSFDVARELAPDFVAFTGDFVSYRSAHEITELARVLRHAPRGRLGTVASLGNHDYGRNWRSIHVADDVSRVASDAGLMMLRNDVRAISGLQFAGLADYWSPEFGARHGMPPTGALVAPVPSLFARPETDARAALRLLASGQPSVVLSHNPDVQDLPIWEGVRGWVLAGHTHGGQVKPPFLAPPILPVRNKRYTAGAFDVGPGRTLYINRGLGFLYQVRLGVRPELTLFTLTRPPAATG